MLFKKEESGSMTLEAAIILPLFIFIFLSIFGMFGMVSARHQVTRALLQTSKSLSLDPYLMEKLKTQQGHVPTVEEALTGFMRSGANDQYFDTKQKWYSGDGSAVAKKRFIGFLTNGTEPGTGGVDPLKSLGVENGLGGVEIKATVSGSELTLTAKYKLKFVFDIFKLQGMQVENTVVSKLWGKK